MRQSSERVYGPYYEADRNRWRVVFHRADGARQALFFESETAALKAATSARDQTDGRTVGDAVAAYLKSIPEAGRDTARHRLAGMLSLPEGVLLRDVTVRTAARLYRERSDKVKPATHHGELAVTKRAFAWAVDQGWIKENPFEGVVAIGTPGKKKPALRVDPSRKFLAYLMSDRSLEATAVLTAFTLGLRASAVVNRRVEDLDDDGWLLWVRDNKTAAGDLEIEIPPYLRERLLELAGSKAPTERIFGDVTRYWLHYHTVRLCEAAGVPRVTPHGLRGSAATRRVRMGFSLEEVAEAIGHADKGRTLKGHYLGGGAMESARARQIEALANPGVSDTPLARIVAKPHIDIESSDETN